MSVDSTVSIAWDVSKSVAVFIKDQFKYVISSSSYIQDLQEEVNNLRYHFNCVKNAVETARKNLEIVHDRVTEWQEEAKDALNKAQDLLDVFPKTTKTCCHGTLPDPHCLYQFSRKAEDRIKDIRKLIRRSEGFKEIGFNGPVMGIKVRDEGVFESRASILSQIMGALADNSKSVVGVWGIGGVGKSSLLDVAEMRIREEMSFDLVIKANAKTSNVKTIQEEIAYWLESDISKKDTVEVRANILRRSLDNEEKQQKKVLIILDNLWEKLDLNSVGIPCGRDNKVKGCKLLLTSRDRNVLEREMHCDTVFRLWALPKEEAKILFERMVGDKVHDDLFKSLVDEALRKCAGLPLLIVEMAKLFKNAGSSELNDALRQIKMFENEGIGKVINDLMQSSYDSLDGKEVKSFLQLCAVYGVPEPKRENLVRYGVGYVLGSEYESMKDARNRLSTLISTLDASSLLLDNGEADIFKIHNLVCDFVALVASRDDPLLMLKDQDKLAIQSLKNKLKSCRAICFLYNDMELPEELECPELHVFLLFSNNKSLKVPDSYFNSMRNLKVLNLTGIHLTRSPSPSAFQFPENLHTLCLDDCLLDNVSLFGKLKGLQILSFVNSKIQRLPKEIGQMGELRLLDLNNCSQLQEIEPNVLGSLTKLEELYMENSFHQWNAGELQTPRTNASLTELNNMNLCTLHISIPDPSVLPEDLKVKELTKHRIQIGNVWDCSSYEVSKKLMLKLNPGNNILYKECIQNILEGIDDLYLDGLNKSVQSIYELSPKAFEKLKHLQVENSSSVHYILRRPYQTFFKTLKSLLLKNLNNLKKICETRVTSKSFDALEVVRVEGCDTMKVLFPFPLFGDFPKLKEIRVVGCKSMQKIVEVDDCGKVEFSNLRALELCELPDIKNFSTSGTTTSITTLDNQVGTQCAFFYGQQVLMPSLESLTMVRLPNLKDIWSDESSLGLSNLRSLEVAWCEFLLKVVSFGSLEKLHKLQTLKVAHCGSVLEIFYLDGSSASGNVEIPSKLTTLSLEELPRLRRIWNNNPCGIIVRFHYLKQLNVFGCNSLRFLFFPSMVKSLVQLRELTVRNCKIMEAIIMEEERFGMETSETLAFPMLTILCFEHLESLTCFSHQKCSRNTRNQDHVKSRCIAVFNEVVAFPRLETLKLTGMDNIEMIWDSQVAADPFPTLKSLWVDECSKLVSIGPSCILPWLCNLEILEAKACGLVEVVFIKLRPLNSLHGNDVASFRLKKLELIDLPELKCVWDEELFHQVNFQCPRSVSVPKCESLTSVFPASLAGYSRQLEKLEIDECGNVGLFENTSRSPALKPFEVHGCNTTEILPLQLENEMPLLKQPPILIKKGINVEARGGPSRELSISAFSIYFNHLRTLKVSHCDGLSKMFTPAIANNLNGLSNLRISYCKMLTEVISDEDGEGHVVTFNQLKYMELDGLTRFKCFSSSRCTLKFPLLEDIIVTGCLKMEFFSKGRTEALKLERVQVLGAAPYWKGNLDITIRNMFEEMAMVVGAKFMQLSEFPMLIGKWQNEIYPMQSSWQLELLVVDQCPSFIYAIPSTLMFVLNKLSRLQVRDCELLEEILDPKGLEAVGSTMLLPKLQHLDLVNLPKLGRLWNEDLQGTLLFNSLGDLTLYNCSNLSHAFSPLMAQCLANLVRMDIKECGHIEGVIADEEGKESAMEKITFPRLSSMKLECLPNLTSFLSGKNHMLDCPRLEHLIIAHCPKMRSLTWQSLMEIRHGTTSLFTPQVQFRRLESMVISHMDNLSKIWNDDPRETFTFKHLRKVDAYNCKSLKNLFPHWVATRLNKLEELRVESCGLEEIVVRGDDIPHSSTTQVLFPELTSLVLHEMPGLRSFCPNLRMNWSFLKELRVTHCDNLNMLHFVASKNKSAQREDHRDLSYKEAHSSLGRDFPNLERLLLFNKDIQMLRKGKFIDDIFGKPKALTLACFHDVNAIFPHRFLLERFQNLQSLEIFCSSFEDIFPEEELIHEGQCSVLENLRELKLSKLCNLKRVWREDHLVSKILQNIETFEVSDCPSLTSLFPIEASFHNLTELVVKNTSGLAHLVTVSALTNLLHLTGMTIIGCAKMKEVVRNDRERERKVISLGKLRRLTLHHLPSLVCFSSTMSCIFRFPSLFSIEVEECPKMKIFSERMLSTPNLKYASLFRHKWQGNWEGDLNTTIQALSA